MAERLSPDLPIAVFDSGGLTVLHEWAGTRFLQLPLGEMLHVEVASSGADETDEASRPKRAAA